MKLIFFYNTLAEISIQSSFVKTLKISLQRLLFSYKALPDQCL